MAAIKSNVGYATLCCVATFSDFVYADNNQLVTDLLSAQARARTCVCDCNTWAPSCWVRLKPVQVKSGRNVMSLVYHPQFCNWSSYSTTCRNRNRWVNRLYISRLKLRQDRLYWYLVLTSAKWLFRQQILSTRISSN